MQSNRLLKAPKLRHTSLIAAAIVELSDRVCDGRDRYVDTVHDGLSGAALVRDADVHESRRDGIVAPSTMHPGGIVRKMKSSTCVCSKCVPQRNAWKSTTQRFLSADNSLALDGHVAQKSAKLFTSFWTEFYQFSYALIKLAHAS